MTPRQIATYLFLALAWGLSFLVLVRVVQAFGWVGAVTFRAFVAAITLIAVAALTRRRLDFSFGPGKLAVVGATTVAGQLIGLSYGTPRIGTAMSAILVAGIPLFSMLISRLWGLERFSGGRLLGLALGFLGIVLLVGFPVAPVTRNFIGGCAACVFGALCAAFGSVYASHRLRRAGAFEVTIGSFLAGGAMTLPLLFLVPVPAPPGVADFAYLLVLGGVMSALTYVQYFSLVAAIGATRAISVEFAVTLVAVVVGALLLGERLSSAQLVGAATIVCGCALVLAGQPRRTGI